MTAKRKNQCTGFTRIVQTKFSDDVIEIGMNSKQDAMGNLAFLSISKVVLRD